MKEEGGEYVHTGSENKTNLYFFLPDTWNGLVQSNKLDRVGTDTKGRSDNILEELSSELKL